MNEPSTRVRTVGAAAHQPSTAPLPGITSAGTCTDQPVPRPIGRPADPLALPAPGSRRGLPAGERAALLIGTAVPDHYAGLPMAAAGTHHMQLVLGSPDIGMMDTCVTVADATRSEMMRGIERFLAERDPSDTALVYLTGYAGLAGRDGRLYFVARDTVPDDLEGTAVPADFLRRQLEECRAASKVVLCDHVDGEPSRSGRPGGSVVRTGGASPAGPRRQVTLDAAGVYVITASPTLQPASVVADPARPSGISRFTGEIVDGLRTGRVGSGSGPWVTADGLAAYLVDRMRDLGLPDDQLPTTSTRAVASNHVIARSAVRARSLLDGTDRAPGPAPASAPQPARGGDVHHPSWPELIAYYRDCLAEARSPAVLPSLRDESVEYFPVRSGSEVLISGNAATAAAPTGVDTFDWKERDVWYGYPLVTLASGGRRHSASPSTPPGVAPLLVRPVEVTVDARGDTALRPTGPVVPHAGVLQACLDDQEAESVLAAWQQSWRAGDQAQMLVAVRQLMLRLGLAELEPLDPAALADDGPKTATRTGAHNAACVLYVESGRSATQAVGAELGAVADGAAQIRGTALEQLRNPAIVRSPQVFQPTLVTPEELNESQEAVVVSAMSRPLTVAAAPPGTGSSQLIVNLVATAVAAGQKVLVASPDAQGLRNLVGRCDRIAPGLLIATGDAEARAEEKHLLTELSRSTDSDPRPRSRAAVAAELVAATARVGAWQDQLTERTVLEAGLRTTCAVRAAAAERLGLPVSVLGSAWRDDDAALTEWIDQAHEMTTVRSLGSWRRHRTAMAYLRAATADGFEPGPLRRTMADPDAFDALQQFARAERRLRRDRRETEKHSDDLLDAQGIALADDVRARSAELLACLVAERAASARPWLDARRMALEPGGRARQACQRELMNDLGGWAVTIDDAEQLAMGPAVFDLVVIDEAHRCTVASVVPLLFRAARALVIGDPVQRHRAPAPSSQRLRRARERSGLSAAWLEEHRLSFHAHSAYDAAATNVDETILLNEHDGAHPGIAGILDDQFYGGRLDVVTDVSSLRRARDPETGESTLLLWEDVHGKPERGSNGGSWRNQAEIDRVVWAVNELRDQLPAEATVGVVTPFRAQAEELRSLFRFGPVQVGSVGDVRLGSCDAVVLSLVAGADTPAQTVRWVESRTGLWISALSQARSHVVTVGHHAFWSQRSGLPAALAPLSSVRSFQVQPVPPASAEPAIEPDPQVELLCARLTGAGYTRIERDALIDGYRCDILVGTPEGSIALLLDRGRPAGRDAARHLSHLLRRRRRLAGSALGSDPETPRVTRVLRIPLWTVGSGEPIAGLID